MKKLPLIFLAFIFFSVSIFSQTEAETRSGETKPSTLEDRNNAKIAELTKFIELEPNN